MTIKRTFIKSSGLLCMILCGFSGHAQQQWKITRLVTTDSDTIQGQVLLEDWNKSPASIQFKDEQGNVTSKSAQEIRSFGIQEPLKTFESKNLKISYYKEIVAEGTSPISRTDSVTVFLEVLLQSNSITLYEGMDDERQIRFFLQKGGELHELRNPVYRISKGESSHLIRTEVYKAQLKYLLPECPTLNTERVGYNDKELVDLLIKYHTYCKTDFKKQFQQEDLGDRVAGGVIYRYASGGGYPASYLGVNVLLVPKKNFNSAFVSIDLGMRIAFKEDLSTESQTARVCFGIYGGKYFGAGEWHPMVFTGISTTNGALDTGVGLSYQRMFAVSTSIGFIPLISNAVGWSFQVRLTPFSNKN